MATGRRVDLAAVGLGVMGIDESQPAVPVDDRLRVAGGVWAVGDITGEGAFTHVALYQSAIAVDDILGEQARPADYRAVPRVTFTDPEIGAVGLSEAAARQAGLSVAVGRAQVAQTARGWIHKAGNDGLIKLVADAQREVLVGATAVGPSGDEVLGLLSLAVHAAIPLASLRSMIYAYPTFHRGIEDVLRDLEAMSGDPAVIQRSLPGPKPGRDHDRGRAQRFTQRSRVFPSSARRVYRSSFSFVRGPAWYLRVTDHTSHGANRGEVVGDG